MNYKGAPRYSLILETSSGIKYYYDVKLGNFVMLRDDNPTKSTLQEIDAVTAIFTDKEQLSQNFSIEEDIARIYISYEFVGEKRIAPVFNNADWSHVASTCRKSGVNFSNKKNFAVLCDIYREILDLNSPFADMILNDEKKLINLSPQTRDAIRNIRTHERATQEKRKYTSLMSDSLDELRIDDIYDKDRSGFFNTFKGRLTRYREFRTIYFNYCKFKKIESEHKINEERVQHKKALIPPQQISMFE